MRILTILALFAAAGVANAQSLSSVTVQALRGASDPAEMVGTKPQPTAAQTQGENETCREEPMWLMQALNDTLAAWQKLRSLCVTQTKNEVQCCKPNSVQAIAKPAANCCEAGDCKRGQDVPSCGADICDHTTQMLRAWGLIDNPREEPVYRFFLVPVKLPGPTDRQASSSTPMIDEWMQVYVRGEWRRMRQSEFPPPCYEIKDHTRFVRPVNSAALCCCAKACACCESCKASKAQPSAPMMPPAGVFVPHPAFQMAQPMPAPGSIMLKPLPTTAPIWVGPQPMPTPTFTIATPAKVRPAHFVTPDFDGHCERITHRGDSVILEGNVLLLCKKHAQPIRVEGERIVINMKDGSYTVDPRMNAVSVTLPKNVIEFRSTGIIGGGVMKIGPTIEWATPTVTPPMAPPACFEKPVQPTRIIPVLPTPPMPPVGDVYYPATQPARIIQVLPVPPHEPPPVERPR